MSDPHHHHPSGPAAKARPGSVTISSYLLYLAAACFAVAAIVGLTTIGAASEIARDLYTDTPFEGMEDAVVVGGVVGGVLQLLIAVGFVVLATQNNRGRNPARIITWVLAAIGICCSGVNLGGTALNGVGMSGGTSGDMPDPEELQRRLNDALPAWYVPVTVTAMLLALLALLAAVILLALPASNDFFRKPHVAGWEPPVPGSSYPAGPTGYPPTPGQQYGPGYPQGPGQRYGPGYPQGPSQPPQQNPPGDQSGPGSTPR